MPKLIEILDREKVQEIKSTLDAFEENGNLYMEMLPFSDLLGAVRSRLKVDLKDGTSSYIRNCLIENLLEIIDIVRNSACQN